MKHRTLTALLLSAATFSASAAGAPIPMTEPVSAAAADDRAVAALPDWIPDDFASALDFRNQFGATGIGSGLICTVFEEEPEQVPEGEPQGILRYELTATGGMANCLKDEVYAAENGALGLRVVVYQPQRVGVLEITHTDTWAQVKTDDPSAQITYSFMVEETDPTYHTLDAYETDINSWLPDCRAEYEQYVQAHGNVSVKDNYVVFCMQGAIGTAYTWQEKSQDYSDIFTYCTTSACSTLSAMAAAGGTSYDIVVYKAANDGAAQIEWDYVQFGSDSLPAERLIADCAVTDNAQTVLLPGMMRIAFLDASSGQRANIPSESDTVELIPTVTRIVDGAEASPVPDIAPVTANRNPYVWDHSQYESCTADIDVLESALPAGFTLAEDCKQVSQYPNGAVNTEFYVNYGEYVEGDLNADGVFSIADAVLLHKWLLGMPDAKLVSWRAGDFSKDGRLNAADLTLMKRELIRRDAFENSVLIITRKNAWVNYDHTDFYTGAMLQDSPELRSLIDKISAKRDVLQYTDTVTWDYPIEDFGAEVLYLPEHTEDGRASLLALSRFGAGNMVLDDPDVIALVRLLTAKDLYAVHGAFDFDESLLRTAPTAVAVTRSGGIAGERTVWRIFSENGAYYASYTDKRSDAEDAFQKAEIGAAEFHDFMAQDLTPYYNQDDPQAENWDAFQYYTVFTYESDAGTYVRGSHANAADLQYALEDLIFGTPVA